MFLPVTLQIFEMGLWYVSLVAIYGTSSHDWSGCFRSWLLYFSSGFLLSHPGRQVADMLRLLPLLLSALPSL